MQKKISDLLQEIERVQYEKLYKMGQEYVPNLTEEDLLQPNDYPDLEYNPYFRYEEGILEGIRSVQTAVRLFLKEAES